MLLPRQLLIACLLAPAISGSPATLIAQGVEIATRVGYSPPTGTQVQLTSGSNMIRAWDRGGTIAGATLGMWLDRRFGLLGTVDFRFTRHQAAADVVCSGVPCLPPPGPMNVSATQLLTSLRLATRLELGDLRLITSVGPALIRFGDAEYQGCPAGGSGSCVYALQHRVAYGAALGLSAAYALSSHFHVSVAADELLYRVESAQASRPPGLWTVSTPRQRALALSAAATFLP